MNWISQGLAGSLLGIALLVAPCVAQEPKDAPKPTEPKSGGTFDSAVKSIKRGAQAAEDALKEQYAKARAAVHSMEVSARVYGRLHWDKALNSSKVDIEVTGGSHITLTGVVADAKAKAKAVELTRDTVGVTQVVDQLTITPPPTTTPAEKP
jgi:BON domain